MFGAPASDPMAASVLELGLGGDLTSQRQADAKKLKKKRVRDESPSLAADELGLQ